MSGITPEARADKVLPVDREALRNTVAVVLTNAGNFPERVQARLLGQNAGPLIDRVTDALIASPVLRALAETVWDEVADSCFVGAAATHVRKHNPYREQAR